MVVRLVRLLVLLIVVSVIKWLMFDRVSVCILIGISFVVRFVVVVFIFVWVRLVFR